MESQAAELARRLARNAEAACRHYLSNGRRQGRYWIVGDVANTPGRSLYVRLEGADSGRGAAGKWTDAALARHGDLLDLIALNRGIDDPRAVLDEARRFLALPPPEPPKSVSGYSRPRPPTASSEAARRLFRAARPVPGTPAEAYLRARGITAPLDEPALRFHPAVWYRGHDRAPRQSFPALLAAVGDSGGAMTGLQRTFLDPRGPMKAPIADPRRALGSLLGNGVWLGLDPAAPLDVLAAGEGLETMLALKSAVPRLPMAAALPAANLAALAFPPALARLYVARDNDAAGLMALERLSARGRAAGIEVLDLVSVLGDWNDDLRAFGPDGVLAWLADRLVPGDLARFASHRDAGMPPMRCGSSAEANAGPERAGSSWIMAGRRSPSVDRARGLPERRFARDDTGTATASGDYFPPPCAEEKSARLCIAKQNSPLPPSSAALRPLAGKPAAGCGPVLSLARDRREGREVRGHTGKQEPAMTYDLPAFLTSRDEPGDEAHAASQTARVCEEMALYGSRPGPGEPDTRPMPEPDALAGALTGIVENFSGVLAGTRLEDDLDPLLWAFANLFHRHAARVERSLDDNEQAQRRSQAEQDGSEIRSVEIERLIDQGQALVERRDAFEAMRDLAAEHYEATVGSAWRPYAGSKVNRRAMTAAVIDSRDFIAARRIAETEILVPKGVRIAFTGGTDYNDLDKIYAVLDRVRAKHAGMVLLHGGSPRGAERIAACWADDRKVAQVVFKPDWTKHRKAAPFKRNDALLDALPIGLVAFPGSGISGNLADKARKLGIPVLGFAGAGA